MDKLMDNNGSIIILFAYYALARHMFSKWRELLRTTIPAYLIYIQIHV